MRTLLLTGFQILLPFLSLIAQEVTITPQYPERGEEVTVTYKPSTQLAGAESATIVFSYSNFYNLAWKMKMNKTGDIWKAAFVLPPYATYATFTVQSGDSIIRPAPDKHYEIAVYKNKVPVQDQSLYKAYSLSAQMGRSPLLAGKQAELFEQELKRYPANYEAKLRLLNYRIGQAQGIEKAKIRKQAEQVIADKFNSNPADQGNMNKVTMGYLIIGESSRLDSIREVVRKRYPDSAIGIELATDFIAKESDTAKRIMLFEKALKKETSKNTRAFTGMHSRLFNLYAIRKDSTKALYHARFMARNEESPYMAGTLKEIARTLSDNDLSLDTARSYAERSLGMAERFPVGVIRYFPETGYIYPYADDSTKKAIYDKARGNLLSLLGLIDFKQGRIPEAEKNMDLAVKKSTDKETLDNVAWFYTRTKQPEKLEQLNVLRRKEMMDKVIKQQIDKPAPALDAFVDLKGNKITPSSFKNKLLVIDFWATWCIPCMQEMPYVQKVYDKYKSNPDIAFLIVNSAARNTLADAQGWSGNKKYTFPVYYNTDPNVGDKFGFNLIPATYVIDRNGHIRFSNIGFEGPDIESRLGLQIDMLLKD